jgi:two-component system LytT family response regulator
MDKLTAIIVDDEANARNTIKLLLQQLKANVSVLAEASNAIEAEQLLTQLKPQLVFLDIQMPGKTGLQLLEDLQPINFDVVFTTAHHEYAIKAFKFSAIDYLLKPIDPQDLLATVNKIQQKQQNISAAQLQILKGILQQSQPTNNTFNKIALATSEGIHFVEIDHIIWCESLTGYTKFHLLNHPPILVSKTIGEYESLLAATHFIRVHQSSLINLKHVKKYVRGEGGQIWMTDNTEIEVSRRKKEDLVSALATLVPRR